MNLLIMAVWLGSGIALTKVIADYTLRGDRNGSER